MYQSEKFAPGGDWPVRGLTVDFRNFALILVGTHEVIDTRRLIKHLFECEATSFGVVAPKVNAHLGAHQRAGITNPVCESSWRQ